MTTFIHITTVAVYDCVATRGYTYMQGEQLHIFMNIMKHQKHYGANLALDRYFTDIQIFFFFFFS